MGQIQVSWTIHYMYINDQQFMFNFINFLINLVEQKRHRRQTVLFPAS